MNSSKPIIFSVRHGQSVTNVCRDLHHRISDAEVWLTEKGHRQAHAAASHLVNFIRDMKPYSPRRIRLMRSSYRRAKQTAHYFSAIFGQYPEFFLDVKEEDARLRELEFGYAGHPDGKPSYADWHTNILRYQGHKYLARRFGGESPADMEPRVRSVLDAIFRDYHENRIDAFIVVSHGLTSRVLTKCRYNYSNEWYENEPNPDNCSIRYLGLCDGGFIFPNDKGQWDENWTPEGSDAGNEKYNPFGTFFSPTEIEFLIDYQTRDPSIMLKIQEWIDTRMLSGIHTTASEAIQKVCK